MFEPEFTRTDNHLAVAAEVNRRLSIPRIWWLNGLLFAVTLLTTTAFGSAAAESFGAGRHLTFDGIVSGYSRLIHLAPGLWSGLSFSMPLLTILLAHELGHYLECQRRAVDASLPYFLPSPLLFGTFGAFIRIRSPIYNREALFDIGVLGPVAGFAALIPFLVTGVSMSKMAAAPAGHDVVSFGAPLAVRLLELVRFPGVPAVNIVLHPMALAAWVGLLATALNLLPVGQLDGGHIVYALGRHEWHRRISLGTVLMLGILGFYYRGWWVWSVILFFIGRRHPLIYDDTPLPGNRRTISLVALVIFVLSFSILPVLT